MKCASKISGGCLQFFRRGTKCLIKFITLEWQTGQFSTSSRTYYQNKI